MFKLFIIIMIVVVVDFQVTAALAFVIIQKCFLLYPIISIRFRSYILMVLMVSTYRCIFNLKILLTYIKRKI